jgi:hypothetical protein
MDTAQQLLTRSRAAIDRFERANADGNPAELAAARTALARCHGEVKRFVAARKAMKSEKLAATIRKITTSVANSSRSGNSSRSATICSIRLGRVALEAHRAEDENDSKREIAQGSISAHSVSRRLSKSK